MHHYTRIAAVLAVVGLTANCSDLTSNPNANPPPISARRDKNPKDVPAVRMDRPPKPRAWDTSDDALVAAIDAQEGHAIIAFKERGSPQALKTGQRAAVSAGTVTAGLNLLRARGVQIVDFYDAIGAAHVIMKSSLAPALRANPLVDYIEPRQLGRIEGVPGTSILAFLPLGTAQSVPWGIQLVRAPDAWSMTRGTGARIYLIDTGVDTTHEDLPHPPSTHCGGGYGGCDDAYPVPHGTHVFGIWTARDNTVGVVGVAPGVNASDVYLWGGCDNSGSCYSTEVTNGLNAAVFDADVINLSLSFPYDAAMSNAVAFDWSNNIVLVAAAGNNGGNTIVYPANYTHVLGVSGVLPDKSFASTSPCAGASSNWGSHVDLAAPFYALSTVPGGYDDETGTPAWCGTSMATPHVSGVAALLRAQNPTWTNQQIVDRLTSTAQDLGAAGWDDHFGYGLVDAVKAVGALDVSINGPSVVFANQSQTWSSVVTGGVSPYTYQWYKDGSSVGTGSSLTMNTGATSFTLRLDVTDAVSTLRSGTKTVSVQLAPPTSCTLDYIPQPHYLKVAWVNGDATASTEVSILRSGGDWQVVGTDAPGVTQHFYVASSGLYYARVRHVKTGYTSSNYCNTGAKTVP